MLLAAAVAGLALFLWLRAADDITVRLREPGQDHAPPPATQTINPALAGQTIVAPAPATRPGTPSGIAADAGGNSTGNSGGGGGGGIWPQFRGPDRAGFVTPGDPALGNAHLARTWPATGPRVRWSVALGEGYAGPAVYGGCVYLMDYDERKAPPTAPGDALRCLSLATGREIWRFAYHLKIKRNHGYSRTVPAVTDRYVVALGPKCQVICVDRHTGQLIWTRDLVGEFGATVPDWYAGQCPLIDGNRVILATGGPGTAPPLSVGGERLGEGPSSSSAKTENPNSKTPSAPSLLIALDLPTGHVVWQSPNPDAWRMTHASIMPMDLAGRHTYVYPASGGVVGVDAATGRILWSTAAWRISIATVPSPVILPGNRIFLTGGYDAGSMILDLGSIWPALSPSAPPVTDRPGEVPSSSKSGIPSPSVALRLKPGLFASTQQTPIFYRDHLWAVRPDGRFACLNLDGKLAWTSPPGTNFGLGPFLIAGDLIYLMDDNGTLVLAEASTTRWQELARAKVLSGTESWAPMALVGHRLLVRDSKRMVCLDVGPEGG